MKKISVVILLLLGINAFGQKNKPQFKLIKTYLTYINSDNAVDTISISSSLNNKELFNKITISIAGVKKQSFTTKDGWTLVDSIFLKNNQNEIKSQFIYLKKTPLHTVLLLFGVLDGAGYRDDFSIINIENNTVQMVFNQTDNNTDVETPVKLTSLDHSERLQFIFRGLRELYKQEDKLHADIGTYNPFFVFTVDNTCKLNRPLTKKYNQQHYVFVGYNYNEKIAILYPRNGSRPRVWKN